MSGLILDSRRPTLSKEVTANYTIRTGDHKNVIVCNSSDHIVLKIPAGLRTGFNCTIIKKGEGTVSIRFTSSFTGQKINGQLQVNLPNGTWLQGKLQHTRGNEYSFEISGGSEIILPPDDPAVPVGTRMISGSATWSGVGLNFDVTTLHYFINDGSNDTEYNSPAETWELAPADPDNPRIDLIVGNDSGESEVITGTPAPNPVKPTIDTTQKCELTFILVPAAATVPGNFANEDIYHENVEWETSANAAVDFESTNDPYDGTKHIEILDHTIADSILFKKGQNLQADNYSHMRFFLKLLPDAPLERKPVIRVVFGEGAGFNVINGNYILSAADGFDSNSDQWQLITIPLSAMTFTSNNFDRILLKIGSPCNIRFDDIVLQGAPIGGNGTSLYVPLAGTDPGENVTGNIELDNDVSFITKNTDQSDYNAIRMGADQIRASVSDGVNNTQAVITPNNIVVNSSNPLSKGISGGADFSGNIGDLDYTQLSAVKALIAAAIPYKVYTAFITQSGTDDPTVTVLQNNLGGNIVWTRDNTGRYIGTLAGAFPENKTWALPASGSDDADTIAWVKILRNFNNNEILITSFDNTTVHSDGILQMTPIEIRVYN